MGTETLLIGSAILGGITSSRQSSNASKAADQQNALNQQGLDLQRENQAFNQDRYNVLQDEYNSWKDIYGHLQEDTVDYYKNITGAKLSNAEVAKIQEANQAANNKIKAAMTQSGRQNSGLETAMLNQNMFSGEMQKAEVRNTAEQRAMEAKTNFLALGLNQATNIRNAQVGVAGAMQNGVANQSTMLGNMGTTAVNQSNMQSAILGNYTNELQSLGGYYDRIRNGSPVTTTPVQPIQPYIPPTTTITNTSPEYGYDMSGF